MRVRTLVLSVLALVAAAAAVTHARSRAPTIEEQEKQLGKGDPRATRARVLVAPDDAVWGPDDALVTIVWFGSFATATAERPIFDAVFKVLAAHRDDVRLVYKHRPIRGGSLEPHEAAIAAGKQGRFWEFHSILYSNPARHDRRSLEDYADKLQLDMKAFRQALEAKEHRARVEADVAYSERVGVVGPYAVYVNGRLVDEPRSFERLRDVVEEERQHALEVMKRKKVKRAAVYREIMRDARPASAAPPAQRPRVVTTPTGTLDSQKIYAVPVGASPQRGRPDARLTIVMFGDFRCPYCARSLATLAEVQRHYGDDVRIVYKHFIVHTNATRAHLAAAAAAAQGRFWEVHDAIYADQRNMDAARLEETAQRLGLDLNDWRAAMTDGRAQAAIDDDRVAAQQFGVTGTPTFFINGRPIIGARQLDAFLAVCDEEILKADSLLASGVSRAALYQTIIANGQLSVR